MPISIEDGGKTLDTRSYLPINYINVMSQVIKHSEENDLENRHDWFLITDRFCTYRWCMFIWVRWFIINGYLRVQERGLLDTLIILLKICNIKQLSNGSPIFVFFILLLIFLGLYFYAMDSLIGISPWKRKVNKTSNLNVLYLFIGFR